MTHEKVGKLTRGVPTMSVCLTMVLAGGIFSAHSETRAQREPHSPLATGVLYGHILEVEQQTPVVQNRNSGKIVRIPMPLKTYKDATTFRSANRLKPL